ncbi:Vegetative incompatibility protein HET-E-1 [Purpureocillium lavendulum]|uniref:Vegetative incompatibility protein HET-E-1 n=1 Tax=Purpureocillium lavendulum TaxID=1247861 RepID=A0AB34FJZ4_9HYPO|nr:Vegetative incompatibility protein HET-E-1 [Purpureocillium lavendulum]
MQSFRASHERNATTDLREDQGVPETSSGKLRWGRATYAGALCFNVAAFLLPALYGTLSKFWIARIDSSMVATSESCVHYIMTLAEVINEGLPRAAWSTIAARPAGAARLSLAYTLLLSQMVLGFILALILVSSSRSFSDAFIPEPVRGRSIAYVRISSFSAFSSAVEAAIAAASRAPDQPDVPLVLSSAKFAINIILDLLLISTFHVGTREPTVEMQAGIHLTCNMVSALLSVLYFLLTNASSLKNAGITSESTMPGPFSPSQNAKMAPVDGDARVVRPENFVRDVKADGQSKIRVGNNYTEVYNYHEPNRNRCLAAVRLSDPRDDKARIEEMKGGLLKDSYRWILENGDFQQWRDDEQSRLLWIKGDPGKGKTMLLGGIIDELKEQTASLVSYFFCQGADSRINNATAVLRGLIYLVLDQQPSLTTHLQKRYDQAGRRIFEDANAWWALSDIFTSILEDPTLKSTFLIIDALDECVKDLTHILKFIVDKSSQCPHVKWIVSSRISIDAIRQPEPNPLASIAYSCIHWVDHLHDVDSHKTSRYIDELRDDGIVHEFLQREYLHWLEALSLLRSMPEGVIAMTRLQVLLERFDESCLLELVRDARRFILSYGWAIGNAPVQGYASGLTFCPTRSLTRRLFQREVPNWIAVKAAVAENWDACLVTLEGHGDSVNTVAFSSDGLRLASTSDDGTVKIWDATTGHCRETFRGYGDEVHSVAFSSNGLRLASTSDDGTVKIWDATTCHCQARFQGHGDEVYSVAFSAGGTRLATASADLTVKIWDATTGQCQETFRGHSRWVRSVTFSPDGMRLASASGDGTIRIWDTITNDCQAMLQGHDDEVHSVAFSPDGMRLASASGDRTIKIWDATTGDCRATLRGHDDKVASVTFSSDGMRLASASDDGTIKIWDTMTGDCRATLRGHSDVVHSVTFSPDGTTLASASGDGTARIWDATTADSPEGRRGQVRSTTIPVRSLVLAWALRYRPQATADCSRATLRGDNDEVNSAVFSPDGMTLASASDDQTVKIWDTTTGHCRATLQGHHRRVLSVAFAPDGLRAASVSGDGTVKNQPLGIHGSSATSKVRMLWLPVGDEQLPYVVQMRAFNRASHMMDHVEKVHLRHEPSRTRFLCRHPQCKHLGDFLTSLDHFKNHVQTVHGVKLRK